MHTKMLTIAEINRTRFAFYCIIRGITKIAFIIYDDNKFYHPLRVICYNFISSSIKITAVMQINIAQLFKRRIDTAYGGIKLLIHRFVDLLNTQFAEMACLVEFEPLLFKQCHPIIATCKDGNHYYGQGINNAMDFGLHDK